MGVCIMSHSCASSSSCGARWRFRQRRLVLLPKCLGLTSGRHNLGFLRASLSVVSALFLAILGPPMFYSFRSNAKATGLTAFMVFTPSIAILAIVFFALFFAASRLDSKWVRVLLFWTPVTIISTLGFGFLVLVAILWLHVPKGY